MSKRQLLCVLGVWVMIFLFLGVPSSWHKIAAIISGVVIIAIAYNLPLPTNEKIEQNKNF